MNSKRFYYILPAILIIGFLLWFFSSIIAYVLIAVVLSLIGQPIVKFLGKIKFRKYHLPRALSALITLLILYAFIAGLIAIFIPIIAYEADVISNIDAQNLINGLKEPLQNLQVTLVKYNIISENENIEVLVTNKIISILNVTNVSDMFNMLITFAGRLFIAFFAVSFTAFFFLKDEHLFINGLMLITPLQYQNEVLQILKDTKKLLSRYFIGLCIDVSLVIALVSIGMTLIGVENALLIGFFAGIMNIVPYVGPIIGATVGVLLGLSSSLQLDFYTEMYPLMLKMLAVFVTVNLIDANIFQPFIYSNSVKAHPLEIFLVIMIAASVAGVPGMILAIPSYTLLRIIAKQFLSNYR